MTEQQRMEEINRAYEILINPILATQYDDRCQSILTQSAQRFNKSRQGWRRTKKTPWTGWPEGCLFPRWRPSQPGAWPLDCATKQGKTSELHHSHEDPPPPSIMKSQCGVLNEERSSQDFPRDREPGGSTAGGIPQSEKERPGGEDDVSEPAKTPCMLRDLRHPVPHPRRKKAEKDNPRQPRQRNQAIRTTHAFKRPWPWVKQPAPKRNLVRKVLEDECGRARERFWNNFFRCEHPQYSTEWIVKRQKMVSPPKEQAAPTTVGAE